MRSLDRRAKESISEKNGDTTFFGLGRLITEKVGKRVLAEKYSRGPIGGGGEKVVWKEKKVRFHRALPYVKTRVDD